MKILFLFNAPRGHLLDAVRRGERHDNNFWGMLRVSRYGVDAWYAEPEQFWPAPVSRLLRRVLSVYWVHLSVFWKIIRADVVFSSTAFGTQFLLALFRIRRPLWVMHDFSITGLLGDEKKLRQKLFRFALERAGGIVTISRREAEVLAGRFPRLAPRIECVRLGVDTGFFTPEEGREERRVLAVGFDSGRDYRTFLDACLALDVPVMIAARQSRLAALGPLPPHVRVASFTHREMVHAYAQTAVVVLPLDISGGFNEAMGCSTLVEAMAMGKAVVATRTPTMESYITDGENGILVPPKDPIALRKAIETLLLDEGMRARLGSAARAFVLSECDAEKQAKKLADYFKRLGEK